MLFCGLIVIIKIFTIFIFFSSNTTQALATHFDFTSFLSRPFFFFLVLGRSFFYIQGVLVEIYSNKAVNVSIVCYSNRTVSC